MLRKRCLSESDLYRYGRTVVRRYHEVRLLPPYSPYPDESCPRAPVCCVLPTDLSLCPIAHPAQKITTLLTRNGIQCMFTNQRMQTRIRKSLNQKSTPLTISGMNTLPWPREHNLTEDCSPIRPTSRELQDEHIPQRLNLEPPPPDRLNRSRRRRPITMYVSFGLYISCVETV
jgi:hypothetical protein